MTAILLLLLAGGFRRPDVPGWSTASVTAPGTTATVGGTATTAAVTQTTTEATVQ